MKSVLLILCTTLTAVSLLSGCTTSSNQNRSSDLLFGNEFVITASDIFSPQKIDSCGKIYYLTDRLEAQSHDITSTQNDLAAINNYIGTIANDEGIGIFINGMNYDTDGNCIYTANFIYNDIIILDSINLIFSVNNQTVQFSSYDPDNIPFDVSNFKNRELSDLNTAISRAANMAIDNRQDIFAPPAQKDSLRGTYCTQYIVKSNMIVYHFELNHGSYINIDAQSGEPVDEYYFNGIYTIQ